jgi:alkylation response protein AidB-like acyl-CoA dehydrogenase
VLLVRSGAPGDLMEFAWASEEAAFRQEIRAFLAAELPDHWLGLIPGQEYASEFTMNFCRKLGERGLLTPHWPVEYGGRGASGWQFIILGEELWRVGEPRGSQYMNVNWIGPAIMLAGTGAQKNYHLARISKGDVLWCQGFSEPEAGTDLAGLRTAAARDGDEYVVNGTKVWTSYAQKAEFCFLLARTDPASSGGQGISIFLVDMATPGLKVETIPSVLDIHEYNRLTFEDVRVPMSARLGPEGEGWEVVKQALAHERIGGPRYARAGLVLQRLEPDVRAAITAGRRDLAHRFLAASAECEAARALVYEAIDQRVKGAPQGRAVAFARVEIVRAERAVAELVLELFEGDGIGRQTIGNAQLKTSMIAGLGGGSVEVQLNGVAHALLGGN